MTMKSNNNDDTEESIPNSTNELTNADSTSPTDQSDAANQKYTDQVQPAGVIGKASFGMANLSDFVNDNFIVVRYAAFASIFGLTAYGLSQTPLFFRYHTVSEIPASYFRSRKVIYGRLVKSLRSENANEPIRCLVRHLSPIERVLPTRVYERVMELHPAAISGKRPDEREDELLLCEIAAIKSPIITDYLSFNERPGEWLERIVQARTVVSIQLLARRVIENQQVERKSKRDIPDLQRTETNPSSVQQIAIGKMYYRSKPMQLFSTDIAESLVRNGHASASSDGLFASEPNERIIDTTDSLAEIRRDAKYLDRLSRAEYEAASDSYGMWADDRVRQARNDIVEEAEFRTNASAWQKLWRWLRRG